MKIAIRHQISLPLGQGLARSVQHLLLTPQTSQVQTVEQWTLDLPGIDGAARFLDGFGNRALLVSQVRPEPDLRISVSGVVSTIDRAGVVGRPSGEPPPALYRRQTAATKPVGAVTASFRSGRGAADRIPLLHDLMARVKDVVGGKAGEATAGEQSKSQSDTAGQTQAQVTLLAEGPPAADFAHAFVGAARALDIPARYVTGYLFDAERQATALHAWAEAWDDGLGWIGFDPMLNYCPSEHHVRVAVGLDAISTQPVRSVPVVGEPRLVEMSIEAAQ